MRTNGPATVPLATGTLFKVADRCFVVTAAHAIKSAKNMDSGLVITAVEGNGVATRGEWICSPEGVQEPDKGLGDIAIYPLDTVQVAELEGKEFVQLREVSLLTELKRGFFLLVGFPQMYCESSGSEGEKVPLGALTFATTVYRGSVNFADFDPEVHFLLNAKDEGLRNERGEEARLKGRHNVPVRLIDGLQGVSGCAVWRIGKPGVPVEEWTQEDAVIVGVQTGTYNRPEVIKVTRWRSVTKLLYEVFPDLRGPLRILMEVR